MDKATSDQINEIRKSRSRERDKLDNILLTLSAGTLSLSATFIAQSTHIITGKIYLFISWIFLIIGLISILFAYIFSELHFKYFEYVVKNDLLSNIDEAENNWRNKLVNIFNWFSFITIVVGISVFVYFAYFNISS